MPNTFIVQHRYNWREIFVRDGKTYQIWHFPDGSVHAELVLAPLGEGADF